MPSRSHPTPDRSAPAYARHAARGTSRSGRPVSDVAVGHVSDGDTIYRIDEKGEDVLFEECEAWGRETPFILVVEGVPGNGWRPFPLPRRFKTPSSSSSSSHRRHARDHVRQAVGLGSGRHRPQQRCSHNACRCDDGGDDGTANHTAPLRRHFVGGSRRRRPRGTPESAHRRSAAIHSPPFTRRWRGHGFASITKFSPGARPKPPNWRRRFSKPCWAVATAAIHWLSTISTFPPAASSTSSSSGTIASTPIFAPSSWGRSHLDCAAIRTTSARS